jgi:hypothetical protein
VTDKAERRWSTGQEARDPSREEVLHQLGSEILGEPIPEKLLHVLQCRRAESEAQSKRRNYGGGAGRISVGPSAARLRAR